VETDNGHDKHGKQQVGGERRKELRQGLNLFRQLWSQTDLDANRTQIKEAIAISTTTRVSVKRPSFTALRTSSQPTPAATKSMIFHAAKVADATTAMNQRRSTIVELEGRAPDTSPRNGAKRCRAKARSIMLPGLVRVRKRRLRWSKSRNQELGAV
jgi:hypothetical protein